MKIAMQQAATIQRRRPTERVGLSAAIGRIEDSGKATTRHARVSRDDSATGHRKRLTAPAASACLHCTMDMTDAKLGELKTRARLLVPVLRQRASETEKLRRLPDATLADLHETELFRLFQPTRYGGIEAPIRAFVDIGATLGRGCGSTSWVFNNLIVHNWMLGYWPRQAQDEVWQANPRALIGSSFVFPAGKAEKTPGGYRLSGKWPFASGIDASDWMMLAAPATRSDGAASEPRFFLVPKSEYSS